MKIPVHILSICTLIFCLQINSSFANNLNEEEFFLGMTCPGDKWVDCHAELWDLKAYGHAKFKDYNKTITLYNPEEHWHLNDCNVGYITRKWKHKAYGKWYTCQQTIHVGSGGYAPEIHWPKDDLVLEGCNPNILPHNLPKYYDKPHYVNKDCDNLQHTYKDQVFNFGGGCKKIIRKWTVINWCTYKPNSSSQKGYYTHFQTIKLVNNEVPHAYETEDIEVNSPDCDKAYVEVPDLVVGGGCSTEYKISNNSDYADSGEADASGYYPVGTHQIHYHVEYGCGATKTFKKTIKVINNIAPSPFCIAGVSIALGAIDEDGDGVPEDGEVLIWAKDLNFKSSSPCDLDLTYSFYPDTLVMSKSYTCANLGLNHVNIYVTDSNGNQSYCTAEIYVQNNNANIANCNASNENQQQDVPVENDIDSSMYHIDTTTVDVPLDTTVVDGGTHDSGGMDAEVIDSSMYEADTTIVVDQPLDTMVVDSTDVDPGIVDEPVSTENSSEPEEESQNETGSLAMIYGRILTPDGEVVSSSITFDGQGIQTAGQTVDGDQVGTDASAFNRETITNSEGNYALANIPMNQMVKISTKAYGNVVVNKPNTDDGILLFEHLTGTSKIENPYTLLAADIDRDGDVDFDDVEYLVDYLSGDIESLPAGDWLFVDASTIFENNLTPWLDIPEAYEVFVDKENHEINFVAVRLGDIGEVKAETRSGLDELRQSIDNQKEGSQIAIKPNPFNSELSLNFRSPESGSATFTLFNLDGRVILSTVLNISKGINDIKLDLSQMNYTGTMIYSVQAESVNHKGKIVRLK